MRKYEFIYLAFLSAKNALSDAHLPGIILGMQKTAVKRFMFPAL